MPLQWIVYDLAGSFGLNNDSDRSTAIMQLPSLDGILVMHGLVSAYHLEFLLVDVICNHANKGCCSKRYFCYLGF